MSPSALRCLYFYRNGGKTLANDEYGGYFTETLQPEAVREGNDESVHKKGRNSEEPAGFPPINKRPKEKAPQ